MCRLVNEGQETVLLPKGKIVGIAHRIPASQVSDFSSDDRGTVPVNSNVVNSIQKVPVSPMFDVNQCKLSIEQKHQLQLFLDKNKDRFSTSMSGLGQSDMFPHKIDTGNDRPVTQRFYRAAPKIRQEIDNQVEELLRHGLIEPSTSEWRSPVVMVKKKNGELRMAIDYRKLNKITKKTNYPLPRLADVWDAIGEADATVFSTIDLKCGFWQMTLDPETKHKSSFVTQNGQYQWNRLPFGLCNAPSSFQMLMSTVLKDLLFKSVIVYVDDLIVFSPNFEAHLKDLQQVFNKLKSANLTVNPSKCHFAQDSVEYLGHILSKEGIKPNPNKIAAVTTYPTPKNQKEVRQFVGLANYYRRFVKGYSTIAAPLFQLLKKDVEWYWSSECQQAFEKLKDNLTKSPVLAYPDTKRQFIITADASTFAIGYILSQKDQDNKERVIEYGGRALRQAEKNYPIRELEALAILEGVRAYRPYVATGHFLVITDHSSLKYIMDSKAETGRIARWATELQMYDFEVRYRKGIVNKNADALSRRTYEQSPGSEEDNPLSKISLLESPLPTAKQQCWETKFEYTFDGAKGNHGEQRAEINSIGLLSSLFNDDLAKLQEECPEVGPMYKYIKNQNIQDNVLLRGDPNQYGMRGDLLYHVYQPRSRSPNPSFKVIHQLVVPKKQRHLVISQYHDSLVGGGHQGFDRTYETIRSRYFWEGIYKDVHSYVSSCQTCQMAKRKYHGKKSPLQPLPVDNLFERWHIDFVGPFTPSPEGHVYILLVVDSFSRWCEAFPVRSQTASEVAKVLYREIFTRFGAPRILVSDRGVQFMSALVSQLCKIFSVKKHSTTPYHPQSNAACERFNSYMEAGLRAYIKDDQSNWPDILPGILMAYRMTPAMRSTEFSPYFLLFGKEMSTPIDTQLLPNFSQAPDFQERLQVVLEGLQVSREVAKENIKRHQEENKKYHDRKAREPQYRIGQKVLVSRESKPVGLSRKLVKPWTGPYYITDKGHIFMQTGSSYIKIRTVPPCVNHPVLKWAHLEIRCLRNWQIMVISQSRLCKGSL
jgi:transposase InsO family protein